MAPPKGTASTLLGSAALFGFAYLSFKAITNKNKDDEVAYKRKRQAASSSGALSSTQYDSNKEIHQVLVSGGPASLAKLKEQTDARRKRIADAYYQAEYERALKIQEEDRIKEEIAQYKAKQQNKGA